MKYFYEDKSGTFSVRMGTRLDFGPHLHGHLEIVGMLEGCAAGFIESRKYEITPGDVFVVFPNQIHYYESRMDEEYIILLFPVEIADEFAYLFHQNIPEDALLKNAMKDTELSYGLRSLNRILENYDKENPAAQMMQVKGYFLLVLGRILTKLALCPANPAERTTVNMILNYCMSHFSERLLLEDVAQALHINKYYISHLFSQRLSMGFGDYVRTLRVGEACRLLEKQTMSMTDVAYSVGFSSTRTFNRAFIRYVGMTPREYQKKQMEVGPGARLLYEHSLHQNHIEHRWNDDTKEKVMLPFMEKDNEGNAYEFGQAEGSGQEID